MTHSGDAPKVNSALVVSQCLFVTAKCKGVQPVWSVTDNNLEFVSRDDNNSHTATCPPSAAKCKGVRPPWNAKYFVTVMFTLEPLTAGDPLCY